MQAYLITPSSHKTLLDQQQNHRTSKQTDLMPSQLPSSTNSCTFGFKSIKQNCMMNANPIKTPSQSILNTVLNDMNTRQSLDGSTSGNNPHQGNQVQWGHHHPSPGPMESMCCTKPSLRQSLPQLLGSLSTRRKNTHQQPKWRSKQKLTDNIRNIYISNRNRYGKAPTSAKTHMLQI